MHLRLLRASNARCRRHSTSELRYYCVKHGTQHERNKRPDSGNWILTRAVSNQAVPHGPFRVVHVQCLPEDHKKSGEKPSKERIQHNVEHRDLDCNIDIYLKRYVTKFAWLTKFECKPVFKLCPIFAFRKTVLIYTYNTSNTTFLLLTGKTIVPSFFLP